MIILHVCEEEAWKAAQTSGAYRAASLETEGFIHCSRPEQVVATTERYYKGRQGLVLLVIDDNAVDAGVKFEMAKNGEAYPHIYGPLNTDAVLDALPFPPQPDGTFVLPQLDYPESDA